MHRISLADGLCPLDRHNLGQELGCRGQEFLYFCLHAFQDTDIDGSLDLICQVPLRVQRRPSICFLCLQL